MTEVIYEDRKTKEDKENLMVFPGDAEMTKVDTGREGDRVLLFQYKTSTSRRFFFWLQDIDAEKDEENVKELNKLINEPGKAVRSQEGREERSDDSIEELSDDHVVPMLKN